MTRTYVVLLSVAALLATTGGPAFAAAAPATDKHSDWLETDLTVATALTTGRYEIKASYRTVISDTPITVYVLQDPSNRRDVLECYSDDGFHTTRTCMKPDPGAP